MIIKVLLLGAFAGAAFLLVHGKRSALSLLIRRALTLTALVVGALAVLFPNAVTGVANAVGVGRGADLILYALCVTFLFTTVGMHLRLAAMHDQLVLLARSVALGQTGQEADTARPAAAEPTR